MTKICIRNYIVEARRVKSSGNGRGKFNGWKMVLERMTKAVKFFFVIFEVSLLSRKC